jgi:hypothetical protein
MPFTIDLRLIDSTFHQPYMRIRQADIHIRTTYSMLLRTLVPTISFESYDLAVHRKNGILKHGCGILTLLAWNIPLCPALKDTEIKSKCTSSL